MPAHPFICLLIIALCLLGSMFAMAAGLYAGTDSAACRSTSAAMGLEHRWGFWMGCMVRDGEHMIPLSTYQDAYARRHQSIKLEQ